MTAPIHMTFPNGIRYCLRELPSSSSVSVGIFLDVSLRSERSGELGISHFLEHMCFRGTSSRTAYEITQQVDALGGIINAYTGKEFTCFYMTVLPEFVDKAIDILFDIVFHSNLDKVSIEAEKAIISEEIKMVEDSPDDKAEELFMGALFPNSYYGKPILGTKESIAGFTPSSLNDFYQHYFNGDGVAIVVSGAVNDSKSIELMIQDKVSMIDFYAMPSKLSPQIPESQPSELVVTRELEQTHICTGFRGIDFSSDDRFALNVFSTLFGGSMSSRLFQEIREKLGLAYSVYSISQFYRSSGVFMIYAGTSNNTCKQALDEIHRQIDGIRTNGVNETEFLRSKNQLKGNILIGLDTSVSWMNWMGRHVMFRSNIQSVSDVLQALDSVTLEDVNRIARIVLNVSQQVTVMLGQPVLTPNSTGC